MVERLSIAILTGNNVNKSCRSWRIRNDIRKVFFLHHNTSLHMVQEQQEQDEENQTQQRQQQQQQKQHIVTVEDLMPVYMQSVQMCSHPEALTGQRAL